LFFDYRGNQTLIYVTRPGAHVQLMGSEHAER